MLVLLMQVVVKKVKLFVDLFVELVFSSQRNVICCLMEGGED